MTAPTDAPRFSPRFWKNITAGFKPAARKIEIIISINTALAEASACNMVSARSAPIVTIKPK